MPEASEEERMAIHLAKIEESNWRQSVDGCKSLTSDLQGVADDDRMASGQVRR